MRQGLPVVRVKIIYDKGEILIEASSKSRSIREMENV